MDSPGIHDDAATELRWPHGGVTVADPKRMVDIHVDLLNAELNHIDGAIRQHDEITKSIKNWAVVTWTASIGLAL